MSKKYINRSTKLLHWVTVLSLLLSLTYISGTFNTTVIRAATTLASFDFSINDGPATAKDLNDTYSTKADNGYTATSGINKSSSLLYASVANPSSNDYRKLEWSKASEYSYNNSKLTATPLIAASSKNPWGETPYFLIKTTSKGYDDISVSFRIGASKKGPRDYKVQYSTNASTYTDISGASFSLEDNKILYQHSYKLPSSISNQNTLYIRIITTSTTTVEKGSTTSDTKSGEIAINNITLTGNATKSTTAAPTKTASPSKTTAPSKTAVPSKTAAPSNTNTSSKNTDDSKNSSASDTSSTAAANSDSSAKTQGTAKNKTIKKLKLTKYKKGGKTIKGKTIKGATVHASIGKQSYTAKASSKGVFTIKLTAKLKKKQTIKIYAEKKGHEKSSTKKYTVK